ncbi:hypothetical protein P3X46_024358 [Hevea brasiliensis]|uniref:Agglutinin domain-containing protein n=1 Tax=Hevea brasiliensis TaxID=3981 RepID=A0ABQ9L2A0_HEVBR|nr:uncharacterized protein LOC131172541 [Hevea brasiliensis]KAJ9158812.1 hypothetical protein P3X46_024358 [Hevea brasiliensis]
MALELPQFAVITTKSLKGRYAHYMTENEEPRGYVNCREEDIFSPFVKIELERKNIDRKYVHLRFCCGNKYWARRGQGSSTNDMRIFASSNQPEADTSKWSCTLFEPISHSDGYFHLIHVHSGKRLRISASTPARLYVDDNDRGTSDAFYDFSFINWDTLVILPKHVAFKGDNGKYLKAIRFGSHEYLQFSSDDGNEEATAYEVTNNPDGHIRISSKVYGKFWRLSPSWIWVDSTDTSGSNVDTLFWPLKVNDNTIALRNAGNERLCKRLTTEGKTDCLNAAVSTITTEARLQVQELVLERHLYDVVYRMEDARIFDERPIVAGTGTASNNTKQASEYTITVLYEDTSSYTFSNSLSIMTGVRTTIQTGLPCIFEGKIGVTAEVTNSLEWNRTTKETKKAEAAYKVVVPSMSSVRVDYVATRGTCNVPFSYTQRDRRSTDGSFDIRQHVDGVYSGVNCYSFHFEQTNPTRLA